MRCQLRINQLKSARPARLHVITMTMITVFNALVVLLSDNWLELKKFILNIVSKIWIRISKEISQFTLILTLYFLKSSNISTAVTGGHFIAWIEAKYEQSTDQEFRYLNFDLANSLHENCCISTNYKYQKVSWGLKIIVTPSFSMFFRVESLKECSFITFSEREAFLRGFLCWLFWSQRCIWVSRQKLSKAAN